MKYFLLPLIVFGLALSVGVQAQELSVKYCEEVKAEKEAYFKKQRDAQLKTFDESTKDLNEQVSKLRENWFHEHTKMREIHEKVNKKYKDKFKAFSKESSLLTKNEFDGGLGGYIAKSIFDEEFSSQARDSLAGGAEVSGSFPCYDRITGDLHSKLCIHVFRGQVLTSVSSRGRLKILDELSESTSSKAPTPLRGDRLEYPLPELINDSLYVDFYQTTDSINGDVMGAGGASAETDKYKEAVARHRDSIIKQWDSKKIDLGNGCNLLLKRKQKNISVEEQEAEDAKVNGAQKVE